MKQLRKKILHELLEIENKIYDKIQDKELLGHTFYVYIIPFTDIDNTRKKILGDIVK